jgi:hypothetical protein
MNDDRTGEEPEYGMPTVEEVREWRRANEDKAKLGILVNPSGSGVAETFRMADAEEYYQMLGLL